MVRSPRWRLPTQSRRNFVVLHSVECELFRGSPPGALHMFSRALYPLPCLSRAGLKGWRRLTPTGSNPIRKLLLQPAISLLLG